MESERTSFGFTEVELADKPTLVRAVFERVAGRYDLMNDLMSWGAHRLWKDAAAARLNPQPGELIVDCAAGTGDMGARLARLADRAHRRRGGAPARIVAVDLTPAMVSRARGRRGAEAMAWAVGDAERLPLGDACADAYLIAFGLRNVAAPTQALAEARRVLKPGGRFLCLEFSRPVSAALRQAYDRYSFDVIPRLGAAVAGNRGAYAYLIESIRRFPDQQRLADMIKAAGFARISVSNFAGGVAALHFACAL
ncbi:MAG TPA: class I SAM-dependent methyltransferase [Caulobacteraceae bacterium]|nr:class I SAM-dependent methyltransferase [Caulobacteraceae bacterium]